MGIISEKVEGVIIHVTINSTNIKSASYNTETKVLTVHFNNGSIYEYQDFPWDLFTKFRASDSQGKFLNEKVKGKYTFNKLA